MYILKIKNPEKNWKTKKPIEKYKLKKPVTRRHREVPPLSLRACYVTRHAGDGVRSSAFFPYCLKSSKKLNTPALWGHPFLNILKCICTYMLLLTHCSPSRDEGSSDITYLKRDLRGSSFKHWCCCNLYLVPPKFQENNRVSTCMLNKTKSTPSITQ